MTKYFLTFKLICMSILRDNNSTKTEVLWIIPLHLSSYSGHTNLDSVDHC